MEKLFLVLLLCLVCFPLVAGHPDHDHSAGGEPNHPSYDQTRFGLLSAVLLFLTGIWGFTQYHKQERASSSSENQEEGSIGGLETHFEGLFLVFLLGAVGGAIIDAYEHAHGIIETIYAPGHVIAASSAAGAGLIFLFVIVIRYRDEGSVWASIPTGYHQSAVAFPLFFLGFVMDQGWHIVFGFESSGIEVMSPTHLWVLTMGLLLVSGPLRRAWYTGVDDTWQDQLHLMLSTAMLLWVLSFLMRLLYPYLTVYPSTWFHKSSLTLGPTMGVAGMLIFSILMMVVFLHLVDRFDIVPGGLTLIYAAAGIGMVAVQLRWYFVPAILATGFAMDLLATWLRPSRQRLLRFRLFAFLVPVIFAVTYHATVWWLGGIIWVTHVWAGSIVFAGIGGLLASHAVQPMSVEHEKRVDNA